MFDWDSAEWLVAQELSHVRKHQPPEWSVFNLSVLIRWEVAQEVWLGLWYLYKKRIVTTFFLLLPVYLAFIAVLSLFFARFHGLEVALEFREIKVK